jgi:UDP:flavonoid glycosyltransferase YjiC (YdhE family)
MFSPYGTLGWFSRLLAAPQPDWPANTSITGFPFYVSPPKADGTDAALAEFLRVGEPPVIFTLGSNVVREAGTFYQESYRAVRQLGCRAVFLAGDNPVVRDPGERPNQIFVTRYAPYEQLFPNATAVVHQGGIGTTGHAMSAGLPMLVVPHVHDQPDNALRVRRLGIAREESRGSYSADTAAKHLKALLTEPRYRERAVWVKDQMQADDGVNQACAAIENTLRRGVVPRSPRASEVLRA